VGVARQRTRIVLVGLLLALGGFALGAIFDDRLDAMATAVPARLERVMQANAVALTVAWLQSGQVLGQSWHEYSRPALEWLGSDASLSVILAAVTAMSLLMMTWRMRSQLLQRFRRHAQTITVAAYSALPLFHADVLADPGHEPDRIAEPLAINEAEEATGSARPDQGDTYVALFQEREESRHGIRSVIEDAVAERKAAQAHAALIADLLAREATLDRPPGVTPSAAGARYTLDSWTSDDRALACATLVHRLLLTHAVRDGIVALDVADRQVQVFLDLPQTATVSIAKLAQDLGSQQPTWQVWVDHGLMITLPEAPSLPRGPWLSMLPLLALDHKARSVRYVPVARWSHLGLYGDAAIKVAHNLLTLLLCQSSPQCLALQFLDAQHLIDTVYDDAPHTVRRMTSACQTLQHISHAVQQGVLRDVRPLVLVVVEPDPTLMPLLSNLLRLLRHQPRVPLRLLVVQPTVHPAGRELYGMLGAGVLTAQGNGQASLIPGIQRWPKASRVLVFQHSFQWEGFPMTMEEPDARGIVRSLPRGPYMLPPVIGDAGRSDAARTLAAVMATAGRETVRPVAVPASAGTSGHTSTQQDADNAAQAGTLSHVPTTAGDATPQPALPAKPTGWLDADRTALVTALITDGAITGGQHPGVTRGRIQQALPEHLKARSRQVLLWLDAADLLSPPIKPGEPYRHPRALRTLDPAALEAVLRATPVPEQAAYMPGGGR
jgi:hypothetical protein